MKRALQFVIAMSFVAMFLVSPVAAATSEGLEWGVAVDDVFNFQFKIVEEGVTTLDEAVNFTVTAAPGAIPDPLTNLTFIPSLMMGVNLNFTYFNGTDVPIEHAIMTIGVILAGGSFAVPIGNFSLLSEWLQTTLFWNENMTIVNDANKWGINYEMEDSEETADMSVHFSKTHGFLIAYSIRVTNKTSGDVSSATLSTIGGGLDIIGLLTDNILYVGIGVGVILIIGVVVCIRRK